MRSVMDFITEQEAAVVNAMGEPQVRQMVGLTFAYGRRQKAHDTADTGAAYATVCGQVLAAVITGVRGLRRPPRPKLIASLTRKIFRLGYTSIFMQSLYTLYIAILNIILAGFADEAVAVLGLYYKI